MADDWDLDERNEPIVFGGTELQLLENQKNGLIGIPSMCASRNGKF